MGNPWLDHVKSVKAGNPKLHLKDILKIAKKSYTKSKTSCAAQYKKCLKSKKNKSKKRQRGGGVASNASPVDGGEPVEETHTETPEKVEAPEQADASTEQADTSTEQAGGRKKRGSRKKGRSRKSKKSKKSRKSRKSKKRR